MGEVTLLPQFSPYLRKKTDHCARHSSCAQGVEESSRPESQGVKGVLMTGQEPSSTVKTQN